MRVNGFTLRHGQAGRLSCATCATLRKHGGFTLLEIFVVIFIIMLLMATMFAGLSKLRARTAMGQARNLVEKCSSALETYRLNFRDYPDAGFEGKTGPEALYYYLVTPFRTGAVLSKGEIESTVNVGPLLSLDEERDTKVIAGKRIIVDPWGTPLNFQINTIKDAQNFDIKIPLIYSCGINRADDLAGGDDIIMGR